MRLDPERCWQAVQSGDSRFDGWIFCAVTSTGIYCRPSCAARTPKRENLDYFATAAAAQSAGFRACKRCRPDASPGSPEWDRRGDLTGRAMRLIADGVVDREGVRGLARRLNYSERHVHRELEAVVGVGPVALARARRAQIARTLLETTELSSIEVAFAAGFSSVRQFYATIREVFALAPGELRRTPRGAKAEPSAVALRLPFRAPFDARGAMAFLGARAVPGAEEWDGSAYRRSLRLPRGLGVVELAGRDAHVEARFWLDDLRDLAAAVQRCRTLLDLDADPAAVDASLGADPVLGPLVRAAPGRRVPGCVDGGELAVRAVLGQQVSVTGATTLAGRLVARHGERLARPVGAVTRAFPSPETLARVSVGELAMPAARARALVAITAAVASGDLVLDGGAERAEAERRLLALPGIGPWTVAYIALRALRDPDAFLETDLGVRRGLERLGQDGRPAEALKLAERWRPYRAYAVQHLWSEAAAAGRAAVSPLAA